MNLKDIKGTLSDLVDVEPKSFGSDAQCKEAAEWLEILKKTEAELEELLGPAISTAFKLHRKLTNQRKVILEKVTAIKGKVRANLANWIANGHPVAKCYTKTHYKVTVVDESKVPDEYFVRVIDMEAIEQWAKTTEGKQAVAGCTIEPVHVLYSTEDKSDAKD